MCIKSEHDNNIEAVICDLVIAMLTVNNWSLHKSLALEQNLRSNGLCDTNKIRSMSRDKIFNLLRNSGYKRSDFVTALLVDRLCDMARLLSQDNMSQLLRLLNDSRVDDLSRFLLKINGVGPCVLETFFSLRNSNR